VKCKRGQDGHSLTCSSKTPLGAVRVRASVVGSGGQRASGSAAVKKGKYTITLRSRTALPAGRYLFKHTATTKLKGEKLFLTRLVTVT
jgi:hypothetical protein